MGTLQIRRVGRTQKEDIQKMNANQRMLQQQFIKQSKERHGFIHATDEEFEKQKNIKKINKQSQDSIYDVI